MLSFGEPTHGWIDVTFRDGVNSYTATVSDVPNDCLRDLAAATSRLLSWSAPETVEFSLEPDFLRCDMVCDGDTLHFSVFEPELEAPAFSAAFPLRAFAAQLHAEMLRIRPRYEAEDGWTQVFPELEVSNLVREAV
jgi:hypothetical protein